jgi:D-arabinose 1-dehydrogenase-like Zn-dependent alcohol dehydrogenase
MESKHPTYTIVSDPKEADAVGRGFHSKSDLNKPQKVYFKFPELQAHEVRIKIHYTGLCYTEVHIVREDFQPLKDWPIVPGHEIVGEITHVGTDVDCLKVGEMVGFGARRDY